MNRNGFLRILKAFRRIASILSHQFGVNLFRMALYLPRFLYEYLNYRSQDTVRNFDSSFVYLSPYLRDRTQHTPIEPIYFLQDTWAARRIFEAKPSHHHDIGSSIRTVGILSQFVPTTMVDIRTIDIELRGLSFVSGSILNLPFSDRSIQSLSSLCVVEHIGLGRYGDPLDPLGSEKAIKELKRVLDDHGNLYISVPVDSTCRTYFNAHRAFTRDYLLHLFRDLELIEERYIYGYNLHKMYDEEKGFGTGLFHLRKTA